MKISTLAFSALSLLLLSPESLKAQVAYTDLHPEMEFEAPPATCEKPSLMIARPDIDLEENKITVVNDVSEAQLNQFLFEFAKFPKNLNDEMIKRGALTHLVGGEGVTANPAWIPTNVKTFDGRPWSAVPGAGGHNQLYIAPAPTMIVASHLYDNHGSVNLVLHERAHGLDSLYHFQAISTSKAWTDLMARNPEVMPFLRKICTAGYCDGNLGEGFAELFAFNNACQATHDEFQEKFPEISAFLDNLDNTEKLLIDEGKLAKPAAELEADYIHALAQNEANRIQYEKDKAAYDEYMANHPPVVEEPIQTPVIVEKVKDVITSEQTRETVSQVTHVVVETAKDAVDAAGRGINFLRNRFFGRNPNQGRSN